MPRLSTLLVALPLAALASTATATQCPERQDVVAQREASGTRPKGAVDILWTEFDPVVILPTRNPASPVVLRALASGTPQSLQLALGGGPNLSLLDNGVAPDTTAGDGIYSGHLPTPEILSRNVPERLGRPILGQLRPVVGGSPTSPAINMVGEVAPADLPPYPITAVNGAPFNYRRTSHVVNYVDATFHVDRNIENSVTRILPRIGDRHDFVDVLSLQRRYVGNRFHGTVRNNVAGIGQNMIDAGASYGSPARLKGFTMFPTLGFYDPQARAYNHETGHQWINHLLGTLDDTQGAHWPVGPLAHFVMGTSGQGGQGIETSCLLTRNGGTVTGTFQQNAREFGPWELYLMGLIAPAQLPASWQFTDQAAARTLITQPNWCNGSTIGLATTDVTLQTVVGANGVRSPTSAQSPRYYTVATLAVSVNRLLDDTELRYLTWLARRGDIDGGLPSATGLATENGMSFHTATGGRARLDFRLDAVFRHGFE